jgi:hypothetical protein
MERFVREAPMLAGTEFYHDFVRVHFGDDSVQCFAWNGNAIAGF